MRAEVDGPVDGMRAFRMPREAMNARWRKLLPGIALGLLVGAFVAPFSSWKTAMAGIAAMGALTGYFYWLGSRHVWVSLSVEGLHARGQTNRRLDIAWHEEVVVTAHNDGHFTGMQLRKANDDGLLKRQVASIFIPDAILDLASFRSMLGRFAGPAHPLRAALALRPATPD